MDFLKSFEAVKQSVQSTAEQAAVGLPSPDVSPEETAEHKVAMTVRDAFIATSELYKLLLNPKTAPLLKREEGELWSIHGRVKSVLDEIRHA